MLYICNSPYQLLNAINHKIHFGSIEDDLVIINMFPDSKGMFERIKKSAFFRDVFYISNPCNDIDKIKQYYYTLFPSSLIRKYTDDFSFLDRTYEKIIVPAYLSNMTKAICAYNGKKTNEYIVIEDGVGTYAYGLYKLSNYEIICSKILRKGIGTCMFSKLLVYDKTLMQVNVGLPIDKMPKIEREDWVLSIFESIYGSSKGFIFPEKYIFMFESEIYGVTTEMQISILNDLANVVGKENIVVKPHPKTDKVKLKGYKILAGVIPWEVYCLYNNMNEKTIVVMNSTAGFTPNIILGDICRLVFVNDYSYFDDSSYSDLCKKMQHCFAEKHKGIDIQRISNTSDYHE